MRTDSSQHLESSKGPPYARQLIAMSCSATRNAFQLCTRCRVKDSMGYVRNLWKNCRLNTCLAFYKVCGQKVVTNDYESVCLVRDFPAASWPWLRLAYTCQWPRQMRTVTGRHPCSKNVSRSQLTWSSLLLFGFEMSNIFPGSARGASQIAREYVRSSWKAYVI